jgi:uncharacterized protein YecT (DUF1311 family)
MGRDPILEEFKMKAAICVIALLAACRAAEADDTSAYVHQDCDQQIHSATAFHACYATNLDNANKALNETYKALLAQKTFYVGSAGALRDVERAWVTYKEKECAYEYGATQSNENYWLAHADCEIRVTEQRIRELQGRPSCTGGDSVCYPHMR